MASINEQIKTLEDTIAAFQTMYKLDPTNKGVKDLIERNQILLNNLRAGLTYNDIQDNNAVAEKFNYAVEGYGKDAVEGDASNITENAKKIKELNSENKEKLLADREALHDKQLEETGQYAPIAGDDYQGNPVEIDTPVLDDDEKLTIFFNPYVDGKNMIPEGEAENIFEFARDVSEELSDNIDELKDKLTKSKDLSTDEREALLKDINDKMVKRETIRDQLNYFVRFVNVKDDRSADEKANVYTDKEFSDILDRLKGIHVGNIDPINDVWGRFPGSRTKGYFGEDEAEYGSITKEEYAQAADILQDIYSEEYAKNPDHPVEPEKLKAAGIDPIDDFRLFQACMSYPDYKYTNRMIKETADRNRVWQRIQMKNDGDNAQPARFYGKMPGYNKIMNNLYNARYNAQSFRWDPEAFSKYKGNQLLQNSEESLRNSIKGQKDIESQENINFFSNKKDNIALAKYLKLNGDDENGAVTLPPPSDTDIKVQFYAGKDDLYNDRLPTNIQFVDKNTGNVVHEVAHSVPRPYTQNLINILQSFTSEPVSISGHTNIGMVGGNPGKSYGRFNSGLENAYRTGDWSLYTNYIGGNKKELKQVRYYWDPDLNDFVTDNGKEFSEFNVNSIFSPYNENYLNNTITDDLQNNPTGLAKKLGYNNKIDMAVDLDVMDQEKLDSILQNDAVKDRFKDKDSLKYFLFHAPDIDIQQYVQDIKDKIISRRTSAIKGNITKKENKFIQALDSSDPQVVRKALLAYAQAKVKLPNVYTGKKLTKGAINSITRDINVLNDRVLDPSDINDIARKYYNGTKSSLEIADKYHRRNDTAINDIKRMHDLYESLIDAKNGGKTDEFNRLGGQDQLDILHTFMSGMDFFNKSHSHLKKDQDMSVDPAKLERTYAGLQLNVRGADTPGNDGLYHPVLYTTTAQKSKDDADKLYGKTAFAKSITADKRADSGVERWFKNRQLNEGALAYHHWKMLHNNNLTDEQQKKNEERLSNPYKKTEEDRITESAFSKSGAGSDARFTSQIIHDIDENGNNTTERVIYNVGQDDSPDISAKEKRKEHNKNVAADQDAGKKEEGLTQEEKAAKRKIYVKAKKAAVNSNKKPVRVVRHKKEKENDKNEEKD